MNNEIKEALRRDKTDFDRTIDITTTGRKTGLPRRTEIWFHNLNDRVYITGTPGRRDWLANLIANPEFTFHLKHTAKADLPTKATPIFEPDERRKVLREITNRLRESRNLDEWVKRSPLIEVKFQVE